MFYRDLYIFFGLKDAFSEKNYYLSLLLWELAGKQLSLLTYFRGGVALYKSIGSLKRFSEDIDPTVEIKGYS